MKLVGSVVIVARLVLFSFFLCGTTSSHDTAVSCDAKTNVCEDGKRRDESSELVCQVHPSRCVGGTSDKNKKKQPSKATTTTTIYQFGGTAQAYKPHVPTTNNNNFSICNVDVYGKQRGSLKVATWPFSRWSQSGFPPILELTLRIWTCGKGGMNRKTGFFTSSSSNSNNNDNKDCCCKLWRGGGGNTEKIGLEIWQARPDGTYSSLRPGQDDDDCRVRTHLDSNNNHESWKFFTVAPGSVGSLGGLIPHAWLDWMPYRPPLLHFLISPSPTTTTTPILVDVPISFQSKTLQQRQSPLSMAYLWRGPDYLKDKVTMGGEKRPVEISSWIPHPKENRIEITIDIYLPAANDVVVAEANPSAHKNGTALFCNVLPFGFPASFLLEPISICSPTLLDFFNL